MIQMAKNYEETPTTVGQRLLSPKDIADMTGIRQRTIQRYFQDGTIPGAFRLGPRIVIRESTFEAWLDAMEKASIEASRQKKEGKKAKR